MNPLLLGLAAHPNVELRLFNPVSPANYSTLFQKDCAAGETILIGKWAVPVLLP